jgi:hypothetical protein
VLGASGLPASARRHLPRIRAGLYGGDLRWLEYLLALSPLAPRDVPYLRALLERGSAMQRTAARRWLARR